MITISFLPTYYYTMDVFLDVLDTFFFDRLYATVLPASESVAKDAGPGSQKTYNQHVGVYYPLQPSSYVDASAWKRDDIVRQAMSLFLIAWYKPSYSLGSKHGLTSTLLATGFSGWPCIS